MLSFKKSFSLYRLAQQGVSAVEFALIAPLMLIIYAGCIELSLMMMVDRKVTSSSATLVDLTARAMDLSSGELEEIFAASRLVFQPYNIDDAKLRVYSVINDGGNLRVDWSEQCGGFAGAPSLDDIDIDLIPLDSTLIVAEIEYEYTSPLEYIISDSRTLSDKFYLRPRRTNQITRSDNSTPSCSV